MKIRFLIIISFFTVNLLGQQVIDSNGNSLLVQPKPKLVTSLNKSIVIDDLESFLSINVEKEEEIKAANYLNYLLKNQFGNIFNYEINSTIKWQIRIEIKEQDKSFINDQHYYIKCDLDKNEIIISSSGQLGLLYGVVTFLNFIQHENGTQRINLFDVDDWPSFSRRGVSAVFKVDQVEELLNYALINRIETVAIASRIYSWYKIDDEYKALLEKIKGWKDRYGGPRIMQSHNIYEKKKIEISNPADIENLLNVIELGIKHGVEKIQILSDDTPPFKFGEGYILTSENDKKKYQHFAEANTYLMTELNNWLSKYSYQSELYYCPGFYTYEDMHYGDMNLFKNTPWEDDAFKPLVRDLNFIGLNMPEEVFIIWTGPFVRSRRITVDDLNDWTNNLKGRKPFLWDNTIYSHFPFTTTPLFTAYNNEFPEDFYLHTAGNGIYINGDANSEDTKAAIITTMDYLWNPENYNAGRSLQMAMESLYGKKSAPLLLEFKEVELEIRKKIGERKLWFEADTLWSIIRKIRFIHDKNPFYNHLNYTRLKALRLQLKNSVPEPLSKENFINECLSIDIKRKDILAKVKLIDEKVFERVKSIMIPLPDFNTIQ
jgi:hypothetical protein